MLKMALVMMCIAMIHGAGPLDAFRANLQSSHCRVDFVVEYYQSGVGSDFLERLRRYQPGSGPGVDPEFIVEGRWEHDGSAEHYVLRVTGGKSFRPDRKSGPLQPVEVLTGKGIFAYHYLRDYEYAVRIDKLSGALPFPIVGPMARDLFTSFDRELESDAKYEKILPTAESIIREGRRLEVEVYRKKIGHSLVGQEIGYDPLVGYLPRFFRKIAYDGGSPPESKDAGVVDCYLIDVKLLTSGGFVPTEWYQVEHNIADFTEKGRNSSYQSFEDIDCSNDKTSVVHFKATAIEDYPGEVGLDQLHGVTAILTPGKTFGRKDGIGKLTLNQIIEKYGNQMNRLNQPTLPNIDVAEQHRFDPKPARTRWEYLAVGLVGMILSYGCYKGLRRRTSALLLTCLSSAVLGCDGTPIVRLSANFVSPRLLYGCASRFWHGPGDPGEGATSRRVGLALPVMRHRQGQPYPTEMPESVGAPLLYDPSVAWLTLPLEVKNEGNRAFTIFKVDAGCSCRQASPKQLPMTLEPGESKQVTIGMSGSRTFRPQSLIFTFSTSTGPLVAPATLFTLPRHHLSPDSTRPASRGHWLESYGWSEDPLNSGRLATFAFPLFRPGAGDPCASDLSPILAVPGRVGRNHPDSLGTDGRQGGAGWVAVGLGLVDGRGAGRFGWHHRD